MTLASLQLIVQEKLLMKYEFDPLFYVGLEGIWGLLITSLIMPFFGGVSTLIEELAYNKTLIAFTLILCVSVSGFNFFGLIVIKYASGVQRATINSSKIIFVWIISISLGWEIFYWQQLVAFSFLMIGTLVYNEIIVLPCPILNATSVKKEYLKKADQRETEMGSALTQVSI